MAENIEVAGLVTRIAIDDSGLEKTLSGLDRQMKLVKSEFDKGSAVLKAYGSGTDELKLKSDALNRQMDIQRAKVTAYHDALQKSKDNMDKNSQAAESLKQRIAATQAAYEASAKATGKESEETQKLKAELDALNQEYQKTSKTIESNAKSIDSNTTKANKAEAEYAKLAAELNKTNAEIIKQESGWNKLSQTLGGVSNRLQTAGDAMSKAGQGLTMSVTAPLAAVGGLSVKAAIDFESAFAGVRKTVDATEAQFAHLSTGIRDMSKEIPVAATEIAKVAEAAGQLGIKTDAILGFSRTMVDLGVATNLSSDQAATALARLANITQMPQDQFDRLGATIVALGNNFATTESEIVEMGLRIAGAGNIIGLSQDQIMAFAASLSSVGIEAEAGGTAISTLMVRLASEVNNGGKSLESFAAIAGMSSAQFKQAFKEDAASAIVAFVEGLGKINEAGGNTFGVLEALGITEIRLRDSVLRLAGAGDVMRDSLNLANKAWDENVALTNEAEQRYATTESQLQIFKNRLTDAAITLGEALIPAMMKLLDSLQPLIERLAAGATWFANLDASTRNTVVGIAGVVAVAGPLLIILGKISTSVSGMIGIFSKMSAAIGAITTANKAAAISTATLSTAATASAGGMTIASRAATILGVSIKAMLGPIGIVIAAIGALIAAFVAVNKYMSQQSIPAVQTYGEASEKAFNRASGSFKNFRDSAKQSLADTSKTSGAQAKELGDKIASGVGGGTKKAAKAAKENLKGVTDALREQIDQAKNELSKNTDMINKLGDAIVTSLKKQYEEQEKAQTAAIDKRIEAEKKSSEQIVKNLESEQEDRTKALDKQIDAEKKASDARLKIYDQEYTEKLKLIDEDLYRQVKGLQDQIDAIDGQTEAEEKAAKEQEHHAKVAELNKQLLAAETAEERERIQKDLSKTIADYERSQLLEQRKTQKEALKAQIDAAKEAANQRKEQLKAEIDAIKEQEKERTAAVQAGLSEQKTALKDHYEGLKETEKDRTTSVQSELQAQKDKLKEHFDQLTQQENLQAEARKLIVAKNNDEIIRLLQTYNPKWQDAGQSFADAFKNGLNSEMQSMGDAVKEAVNIAPVIDEQVKSLEVLEEKLKSIESKTGGADTGGGGGAGLGGLTTGFDTATLSADEFTDSVVNGVVPAMEDMGESAETASEEVVDAFLGLRNKATVELNSLKWSGRAVTEETASNIADTFFAMGDEITDKMKKDHQTQLSQMQIFLANSKELTAKEKEEALTRLKEAQASQEKELQDGQNRVAEIMLTAMEQKRGITQQEYDEIAKIQEKMTQSAVQVLTNSVDQQTELLERLKQEASDLSAQQAADVVKNSIKQRDEVIKTAENQYQVIVAQITKQRDEMGTITAEQADKLIAEAKRQRDETVKQAEDMHEKVLDEAKKQAEGHVDNVDWETGEILTRWESLKAGWERSTKELNTVFFNFFENLWAKAKTTFGNLKTDGLAKYEELKTGLSQKLEDIKNFFVSIWNDIQEFFKNIDLKKIGQDIVQGLLDGLNSKTSKILEWASFTSGGIGKTVSDVLWIKSPSRKMRKLGEYTGEGFELGLKDKVSDIERQAQALAIAAMPGMASMDISPFGVQGATDAPSGGAVNITNNFADLMRGANFYVRSDNDIEVIAQKLSGKITSNTRGLGGAPG